MIRLWVGGTGVEPLIVEDASLGFSADRWAHVVVTFDSVATTLFVNGEPVALGVAVSPPSGHSGVELAGLVDEVAFYDRALSGSEVSAHWDSSGRAGTVPPPGGLRVDVATNGGGLDASWDAPVVPPIGYVVRAYAGTDLVGSVAAPGSATAVKVRTHGEADRVEVVAVTTAGESEAAGASLAGAQVSSADLYGATVAGDSPAAWLRLDEQSGAPFAADSASGGVGHVVDFVKNRAPGSAAVEFGGQSAMRDPDDGAAARVNSRAALMTGSEVGSGSDWSIEMWIRGESGSKVWAQALTPSDDFAFVSVDDSSVTFGQTQASVPTEVMDGDWHHLVVSVSNSVASGYIDGVLVQSPTPTSPEGWWGSTYAPFIVHAVESQNGAFIDEVALYGHALSAAQVATHFAASGRGLVTTATIPAGQVVGEDGSPYLTVNIEAAVATTTLPQGEVVVRDGTTEIGRGLVGPTGVAEVLISPIELGVRQLTAEFVSSTTMFVDSEPATASVDIRKAGSVITAEVVDGPVIAGETWQAKVSVTSPLKAPVGTVSVKGDGVTVASAALSVADEGSIELTMVALPPGVATFELFYDGATTVAPSGGSFEVRVVDKVIIDPVRGPPSTVSALEPALWSVGVAAAFTANPMTPSGSVLAVVDGVADSASLTPIVAGEAAVPVTVSTAGTHDVEFEFVSDSEWFLGSRSDATEIQVAKSATRTTVESDKAVASSSEPVTFTAEVSQLNGNHLVSGSIEFEAAGQTVSIDLVNGAASWTTTLPAGTHPVTATYTANAVFATSHKTISQIVDAPASVELEASGTSVVVGDSVTFTATVRDGNDNPVRVGSVEFGNGNKPLGIAWLDGDGKAELSTIIKSVDGLSVSATYSGAGYQSATSPNTITVSATRRNSDIHAELLNGPVVFGQQPVLRVEATAVAWLPFPSPVTVKVDGTEVASWSLWAGTVTRAVPFPSGDRLSVGSHSITVTHAADGTWQSGMVQVPFTVDKADVTIAPSVDPVITTADTQVEAPFNVKAKSPGVGTPTGTISVEIDGNPVMVDGTPLVVSTTLGSVNIPTVGLTLGEHQVVLVYSGDDSFNAMASAPVTLTVRAPATVTATVLTASPTALGAPVQLSVTVSGASGTAAGSVVVYDGERSVGLGTLSGGAAIVTTPYLWSGTRSLTVKYLGDSTYASAVSAPVSHTVTPGSITSVTVMASPDPLVAGRSNKLIAVLGGSGDPHVRPQGLVQFTDGDDKPLGVAAVRPDGTALLSIADLEAAPIVITARHVGSGDFNYPDGGASTPTTFNVEEPLAVATSIDTTRGVAPLTVNATVDSVSNGATLKWNFGDGSPEVIIDPAISDTVSHTYTTPGLYKAIVVAETASQRVFETHTVRVAADEPASADPGGDRRGVTGKPMAFDASNSRPHFGIDSWHWDFGDGSTATTESPSHVYNSPGDYTVTLTVTSGEQTATSTAKVSIIDPVPDAVVSVTVGSGGSLLAGAEVVVNDQIAGRVQAVTNSSGVAQLEGLADGTYTVYAVAAGYQPGSATLSVEDAGGVATIELNAGALGSATLTHTQLSPAEIIAAGIDPTAPENQHVVAFEIHLPYTVPQTIHYLPSAGGGFTTPGCSSSCTFEVGPWKITGTPVINAAGETEAIGWIIIPGAVGFSKQFFDVTLIVTNLSGETFSFSDGVAGLNLPEGLSLAHLAEPQTLARTLNVPGGGTGSVSWIVRGDNAGSYDLSATYAAALSPLGTPVRFTASTSEPIRVHGPESLTMTVTADRSTVKYTPMRVNVTVTNTAGVALDNPLVVFGETPAGALLQPRQQTRWEQASLEPGESMSADLRLVALRDGDIDLEHAFVRIVAGEQLDANTFIAQDPELAPELRTPETQPFGKIKVTWDADGHSYDVYAFDPTTGRFADNPARSGVSGGSATIDAPPGQAQLVAISRVGGPRPTMYHNAVEATGGATVAQPTAYQLSCDLGDTRISLSFEDLDWPIDRWRLSDSSGTILAEDEISPPVSDGTIHVPIGGEVDTAYISVSNDHDRYHGERTWSEPTGFAGCGVAPDGYKRGNLDSVGRHGDPVNTLTGATWLSETDLDSPPGISGLEWSRNYDSGGTAGAASWAFPFSERLTANLDGTVTYRSATTREVVFVPDGLGGFEMVAEEHGRLETTPTGWRIVYPDGTVTAFDPSGRVSARSFGYGQVVTAQRDSAGRLTKLTSNVKIDGSVHLSFDYTGDRLTAVHSADGRTVTYGYDTAGHLTTTTLPGGVTWTYGYDTFGRMTDIIDPAGVGVTHNTIDAFGRVATQTNAHGLATSYDYKVTGIALVAGAEHATVATDLTDATTVLHQYDALERLVAVTDVLGNTTTTGYGPLDLATSVTSPTGETVATTYFPPGVPAAGLIETITTAFTETAYAYHSHLRVTSEEVTSVTDPTAAPMITTYDYDGTGRQPVAVHAPGGITTLFEIDLRGRITETTDADGVTATLSYDTLNRLVGVTDALGNETSFEYDPAGRVTKATSPEGRATEWAYDTAGRLVRTDHPDGTHSTLGYDLYGRQVSATDQAAMTTSFAYDPATGALLGSTDPLGRVTTYGYDRYGAPITTTHPDNSVSGVGYDAAGRVVSSTDEEGRVTVYGYDGDGRPVSVTDPAGLVTSTSYTTGGKVGSVTAPDGTTTSYTYDPYGREASVTTVDGTTATTYQPSGLVDKITDARGVDSVYAYTSAGRVQQVTVDGDRHTVYGYDAVGRERSVTHPGGRTESVIFDGDGLVVSYQSPTGLITETTFDDAGRPVVVSDPGGVATTTTYDPRGMVASVTRSGEGPVSYSYDNAGQLVGATDANGNTTSYTPDSRGRTVRVTDPTGAYQDTGFDFSGRVTSSTDPLGRQSVTGYDVAGRVANVIDASGRVMTFGYDTAGRVSGWTATNTATAEVLAATFAYDPATSRLVTETVEGRTWTNTYNTRGDLTARVNPDGRRLGWSYDSLGRVSSVTGVDGLHRDFSYDQADQITSVTTGQKVADTFTGADGDGLDPAKWATSTGGGGTVSVGSNTAKLAVTATNGSRAQFSYKGEPRDLTDTTFTVDLSGAGASSRLLVYNRFVDDANYDLVEFRPGANKATISRAGLWWNNTLGTVGVPTSGSFKVRVATSQNWVQVKVWPVGAAEPAVWGVSFNDFLPFFWGTPKWVAVGGTNAAGDIRVDDVSIAATGTDTLATYNYDADGRLVGETLPGGVTRTWNYSQGRLVGYTQSGGGLGRSTSLAYDSSGRVASETTAGVATIYSYDPAGQLVGVDAPGTTNDATYSYDNAGRRASQSVGGATTGYSYDTAGQLTSASPAGGTPTVYSYDGAGRRVAETTGANVRAYGYDPAGRLTTTATNTTTITRGLDPTGLPETITGPDGTTRLDWVPGGELVSLTRPGQGAATLTRPTGDMAWSSVTQGTTTKAVSTDIHHSTLASTGGVGVAGSYRAFGAPQGTPTAGTVSLGYRGEVVIDGLSFLRARNYDPTTGTFTTTDPIAGLPGAAGAANPYAYVNNNPLNATDPTGLFSLPGFLDGIGAAALHGGTPAAAQQLLGNIWDQSALYRAALATGASKAATWVTDHKELIAATVISVAVGAACTGLSLGIGAVGCVALSGAVGGALYGGLTSCGNGNSATTCATGIVTEAGIWAATGLLTYGAGRAITGAGRAVLTRIANTETATALTSKITARLAQRGQTGAIRLPGKTTTHALDETTNVFTHGIPSSADDVGLSGRGLVPASGTRVRPAGVPDEWKVVPTRSAGGTRYYDPTNPGNSVRVMQGNPSSPFPNSQRPYVRWQRNGHALDVNGNPLPSANVPEAHIPLSDFRFLPGVFG